MRRLGAVLVPWAVLFALGCLCFARLFALPSGLIVDGRRPSIDFANHGDPRPIGNDATFVFLPHHLYVAKVLAEFGHPPALGQLRVRRPADGRQPPERSLLSAGLDRLVRVQPRHARLADGRSPALGWAGDVPPAREPRASAGGRPPWRPESTRPLPICWPRRSRAIIPTSGRRAGFPGRSGPTAEHRAGRIAGSSPCLPFWPWLT